jgi:hypothetical protein
MGLGFLIDFAFDARAITRRAAEALVSKNQALQRIHRVHYALSLSYQRRLNTSFVAISAHRL